MIQPEMPAVMSYNYASGDTVGMSRLDTFTDRRPMWNNPLNKPWEQSNWTDNSDWENPLRDILNDIKITEEEVDMGTRRLVKVIIVDPNENVPLDKAVLYMGDEQLTDLTDTEIFYDLNIKELLNKHNEFRTNIIDKDASKSRDKDVYLEEIRIRDLKMVVLAIAQF